MSQTRQLAAIMFTDIAGYTTMMGKDEDRALSLLNKNREIQKPLIEKYNGHWLKELGDGVLAQFNSAYDAVKCAIDIQHAVNVGFEGRLRIGIHLGDITNENEDVYGDGVNVASRIQGIADPGGIYISESVENAIRNRSDIELKYLGEANLKNVDYPVKLYAVQGDGFPVPVFKQRVLGSKRTKVFVFLSIVTVLIIAGWFILGKNKDSTGGTSQIRSLAVLPFENLTGSDKQEYIVEGLYDALISELSHINSLRIISKTSSSRFEKSNKSLTQIAGDLGVDAVIESSMMEFGDSIQLNVQLIKAAPKEDHIWSGFFYSDIRNVLPMVSDVTKKVADNIKVVLSNEETNLINEDNSMDPDILKLYLQGKYQLNKYSPEGFKKGMEYLDQVIAADPLNAKAWATMAIAYADLAHLPYTS